jgi:hypothetical protein
VRNFLLIAILAGIIGVPGCREPGAKGIRPDRTLKPFIPSDTPVLAGMDLDTIKATPLYKRHEGQLNLPFLKAASERVGLDPRKDISVILLAWRGAQPLAIVRGRFSSSELGPKLTSLGARETRHNGTPLFVSDGGESLFFPEKNVLIAAPVEALRPVIDAGRNGRVPNDIAARMQTLPGSAQLWAVSTQGLGLSRVPMRSDIDSALSNIVGYVTGGIMGMTIDAGVHLQADLSCISNQGAQRVHDALRGGIGLARLTTKDDELDLLRVYDAIRVDQDQQTVHVRADLGPELADKLIAYLPKLGGRSRALMNR